MNKYRFSRRSLERLQTCDPLLQKLFHRVIKICDCTILEGVRSDERQMELFRQDLSKLDGVNKKSKHQANDHGYSMAIDVAPYPIPKDWGKNDTKELARFYYFMGIVKGVAATLNIKIRCGGDWDGDNQFNDQSFDDIIHFELS